MRRRFLFFFALVLLCAPLASADARRKRGTEVNSDELIRSTLPHLLGQALTGDRAWEDLVYLCDRIGHRLSGSASLDRAVEWATGRLAEGGMVHARAEPVMVPRWVRGQESARMLEPIERELPMLGLGGSVGTGDSPLEAEVLVVGSFDELTERAAEASGKIVLFDVPFTTYGETVKYRGGGASAAARAGAVAALVRSVTPQSLQSPHTGNMGYADDAAKIPTAAITVEDAATIHRLADRGVPVRVRLAMEARSEDDVESANVVAEVPGGERTHEIVVIGCHLDSWDVGQGAQDDGAGCVMVMEAGRLIAALPTAPRRTIRVVLYTNEENGLRGGKTYAEAHAEEEHFAAIEADIGCGEPRGWRLDVRRGATEEDVSANQEAAEARLAPLLEALEPVGATSITMGGAGADVWPLTAKGVIGFGLDMDTSGYWPIHHTHADTIDKIDPQELRRNVATVTMTAFWLAEIEEALVDPSQPVFEKPD